MAAIATNDDTEESLHYDTSDLPPKIRKMGDGPNDPWWEYDGEPLFGEDTDLVHDRVAELVNDDRDIGRYSPRNAFRKTTKIRTKDRDAFDERLRERVEEVDAEFGFLTIDRLQGGVDVYQKGERRTDVTFDPRFGRPAGLGGAAYYREQILLEILRYEVEVFWDRVLEPVFEEFNEQYPY